MVRICLENNCKKHSNFNLSNEIIGTFDIQHPIEPTKRLVHSFIEGPRCDNIYRGTAKLNWGKIVVNLDLECVDTIDCAMTEGTFVALNTNPVYFLQNNSSFDRLLGSIDGNLFTIVCENSKSFDLIHWMVIAEKKDQYVKDWERTNSSGSLKTEYTEPIVEENDDDEIEMISMIKKI